VPLTRFDKIHFKMSDCVLRYPLQYDVTLLHYIHKTLVMLKVCILRSVMLSVFMLSIFMVRVVIVSAVKLRVVMLSVIILRDIILSVFILILLYRVSLC
jgi:hypothetical protein